MNFQEAVVEFKGTYSREILEYYGYTDTRKKYRSICSEAHKNGDKNPSMSIFVEGNAYRLKDFGGGSEMFSAIDLVMKKEGLSFRDAVYKCAEICRVTIDRQQDDYPKDIQYIIKGLYKKAERDGFSVKAITDTYHYLYHNTEGKKLFDKYRIDFVDGDGERKKHVAIGIENNGFVCLDGRKNKINTLIAMYGDFKQYEPDSIVYLPEGEKCTEACKKKGMQNVVTAGSSGEWKSKGKHFAPYFKDTHVVILQDFDKSGEKLTKDMISALSGIVKDIKVVIPDKSEPGADVADFFQNGGTLEQLQEMIKNAPVTQVEPKRTTTEKKPPDKPPDSNKPDLLQFHHIGQNGRITGVFHAAIFEYLKEHHDLLVCGGTVYIYGDGHFEADSTGARLKSMIRELIYPQFVKSTIINNIFALFLQDITLEVQADELNSYPAHWICFQNGMYDPKKKILIPHSPKYRCINQIPHEYKLGAGYKGDVTEEFLHFVCEQSDDREMLLQFFGYCLTRDTSQQKFLVLNGEGGTGKSTLIRLLESMVGSRNISNISLTDLQQRFASFGLMGKLVNSCADLEIQALEDTSMLKKCLGEDSLRAEQKGKDAISFKSYAKLIFSTNELPLVRSEKTNGFYRRLLVLTMNRVPLQKNPNLFHELEQEIDYLLQISVQALERMYEQECITVSAGSEKAVDRLRQDSDTVQAFLSELCVDYDKGKIERTDFYGQYVKYCGETDRQTLTKNNFYRSLRIKGYMEMKIHGYRYFGGVCYLKDAPKNAPGTEKMPPEDEFMEYDGEPPFLK
ncbi:MAG: phage/plasmid primase, P4 family [Clostridiales bacterium]|nr:phage/plasmid primase, P4 family [Clostridiales bacterium]